MNRRIGIFGGTFDPPHVGHTVIAKQAMEQHDLNLVYFMVAGDPWQKPTDRTAGIHRFNMTDLALDKHRSWAKINALEFQRIGPTYTIDTLQHFKMVSNADIFLIVGSDCDLSTWKDADEIPKLCTVSRQYRWLNLSSTTIRERVANDLPVTDLVDDKVYDYIMDRGLYDAG